MKTYSLLLAAGMVVSSSADEWPQYRGPHHTGASKESLAPWGEGRLESHLENFSDQTDLVPLRLPMDSQLLSTLCKARKRLQCWMRALDCRVWTAALDAADYGHDGGNAGANDNKGGDGPRSTPSIDGGSIYVLSADFVLVSYSLKNGQKQWSHDLLGDFAGQQIKWKNAASPVVDGNLVIVGGGGAGQSLLAFNKVTGKLAWKTGTETMTHATPVVAEIHGVRQVIFFCVSGLVSVEINSGKLLWKQPFKFAVSTAASPVVDGNVVFCSAGYGVGGGAYKVSMKGGNGARTKSGVSLATNMWRIIGALPCLRTAICTVCLASKNMVTAPLNAWTSLPAKSNGNRKGSVRAM